MISWRNRVVGGGNLKIWMKLDNFFLFFQFFNFFVDFFLLVSRFPICDVSLHLLDSLVISKPTASSCIHKISVNLNEIQIQLLCSDCHNSLIRTSFNFENCLQCLLLGLTELESLFGGLNSGFGWLFARLAEKKWLKSVQIGWNWLKSGGSEERPFWES